MVADLLMTPMYPLFSLEKELKRAVLLRDLRLLISRQRFPLYWELQGLMAQWAGY